MLPFPAFDPAAITAEKDAVSRYHSFGSSVPFGLLQSNNVTTLCNTGSQQGVDVADTVTPLTAAVRTLNVPNVSSSSRDLALAALCFMRAAFLSARFPRRFFRANALCLSLNYMSRCYLPRFLPSFFPTCWVRHSHHASTSPSSTLLLTRACPPSIPPLLASGHTFAAAAAASQLCYTAGTVAAGNDFVLLGCITASRCCWEACTVSIDEFSHQSMS